MPPPAVLSLLVMLAVGAAAPSEPFAALRRADERLAAIAYRLTVGNAALCRVRAPATGLVLQAIDQYPNAIRNHARAVFGFETPVAVEAVVLGSPADHAGVRAGDGLVMVAGRPLATGGKGTDDRDAALAAIEAAPIPLRLTLRRGGVDRDVALTPQPACRVRAEVAAGGTLAARTDGSAIQLGDAILARYDDEGVAVIVAHELAHIVLGHHALGPAPHAVIQAREDAADRLSVVLLYNAGDDPLAPARFWRAHGEEIERGRPRDHPPPAARAAAVEQAAAAIPAGAARPYAPPGLAQ